MGQRKEHSESPGFLAPVGLRKFFDENWLKLNLLTPVHVYSSQEQRRRHSMPQESWWQVCVGWLRYHHIQMRWDIERVLARLLHRRWGS